jgi:uncharacterized protein (DUF2147 family)
MYSSKFQAILLFLMIFIIKSASAQAKDGDAILGRFQNPDKDAKIIIYKENNLYFGKVIESSGKIPVGTILLKSLSFAVGKWTGKVFVYQRNHEYDCSAVLPSASIMKLTVKVGIFRKDLEFTRLNN